MSSFELLPFSEDHLFRNLGNDLLGPVEIADHGRAKYLSRYLQEIKTKTIVVEYNYTDGDYLDDFASYYVKCFYSYPRSCKRLHFFSCQITKQEFFDFVCGDLEPTKTGIFRIAYLGFIVARPLPDAIIGRTVLATYEPDGGRRHYPCTKDYAANLFGVELTVRSLAFQEQDSVLAACATVALWCALHKTAELFGTSTPTPAAITRVANQVVYPSRPIPSHGLNIQQICNSIRYLELEPEVVEVRKNVPLVSLIYGHLEMGLPVLLMAEVEGRGLHAITLTGYSLRNHRISTTEVAAGEQSIPMTGLRVDEFFGHDDQIGPFARLHVKPSITVNQNVYPVVFDGSWIDPVTNKYLTLYPKVIIVPVYHKIRVTFLDVQQWLTRLTEVLQVLRTLGTPLDLEWDLSLRMTNSYKELLKGSGLARDRLESLLLRQHPRFIWHALLRVAGVTTLELLVDATDMARSFPIYEVVWYNTNIHAAMNQILNDISVKYTLIQILTQRFYDLLNNAPPP